MSMRITEVCNKSPYLFLIQGNVYDIPQRLREIDPSYFVVWNNKRKKYEVHSTENIGNTYCFTVPYDELDIRTIQYARETRVERSDIIFKQIDEHNEMIEKEIKRQRQNLFEDIGRETFDMEMFRNSLEV